MANGIFDALSPLLVNLLCAALTLLAAGYQVEGYLSGYTA